MKLLSTIKNTSAKLAVLAITSTPMVAMANDKGVSGVTSRLTEAASSFGPLISIAAFVAGMAALFKAVTTIMNHSENPRENPLKNVVFFGLAAMLGLGYTFSSSVLLQTMFKEDKSKSVDEKIFNVNANSSK